jgi:hypothetical protein
MAGFSLFSEPVKGLIIYRFQVRILVGPTTHDRVAALLPRYARDFSSGLPMLSPVLPAAE